MFAWVDKILEKVLRRKPTAGRYLVTDWKTPSGKIHIGALRGVLIHHQIYQALLERGKPAEFIYGFDDYDPMDAVPVYLPAKYKNYLGKPLANIPSPDGSKKSFAQFYADKFIYVFHQLGAKPKIISSSQLYRQGKFNCAFDLVIQNAEKIRRLYWKISKQKQPADWLPIQMVCKKCGRIGTTRAYAYRDGKVYYKCDRNYVNYTAGCGYSGADSPYDGRAKLPWKVEWAAKWFILGSDIEGAGKDHQTKGGSHDLSSAIFEQIFQGKTPVNIFYEWFLAGGKSMSSSQGIGMPAEEILEVLPPDLVRFLILRTKPRSQINFDLSGDSIPQLYNDYDRFQSNWAYKFSKVVFLVQMPHIKIEEQAEKEKGEPLTKNERQELRERQKYAKIWLDKYADKKYIFKLQTRLPKAKLTDRQKRFLAELLNVYQGKQSWRGEDLHAQIHRLKTKLKLKPQLAFGAVYQIFLNRSDGPQAGWFLASLKKDFVSRRLKEASQK